MNKFDPEHNILSNKSHPLSSLSLIHYILIRKEFTKHMQLDFQLKSNAILILFT